MFWYKTEANDLGDGTKNLFVSDTSEKSAPI